MTDWREELDNLVDELKADREHLAVKASLARAEWEHINRVLADCGGNVSETARRLGITEKSVYNKLKRHGLM